MSESIEQLGGGLARELGDEPEIVIDLRGEGPASPNGQLFSVHTPKAYERFVKPTLDRLGGLLLLLLVSPIMLGISLAILLSMGRPVLFKQYRTGRGGRPFTMYKFRSMGTDRRGSLQPFDGPERRRTHKSPDDPRLTRLGGFLRKWSLDELPQFLNVVRGEMSLVGPRPELVSIVEQYEYWQHHRHQVKPGVTGLWQVSARNGKPMHEATDIDLVYLQRIGFREDCRILVKTIPAILSSEPGY